MASAHISDRHPPIVILPGLMCDSRMFASQLAAFPGSRAIDGYYGHADHLEDMAEVALRQMPSEACVIGHSMGARVALEIVRLSPERITRLILANTGVHAVREGECGHRYALRDLGREMGMAALVDQWLPPMLAEASRSDLALVRKLQSMCVDAGLSTYEAQIAALLSRPAVDNVLRGISCPTWVVTGTEDQWAPPAQHEAIATVIAGSTLRIVAGAGHMLPAEKPEEFNALIAEWMTFPSSTNFNRSNHFYGEDHDRIP